MECHQFYCCFTLILPLTRSLSPFPLASLPHLHSFHDYPSTSRLLFPSTIPCTQQLTPPLHIITSTVATTITYTITITPTIILTITLSITFIIPTVEINQGMDERNERLVFDQIVQSCCGGTVSVCVCVCLSVFIHIYVCMCVTFPFESESLISLYSLPIIPSSPLLLFVHSYLLGLHSYLPMFPSSSLPTFPSYLPFFYSLLIFLSFLPFFPSPLLSYLPFISSSSLFLSSHLLIFPSSHPFLSGGEASVLLSESKTVTGTQVYTLHPKSRILRRLCLMSF